MAATTAKVLPMKAEKTEKAETKAMQARETEAGKAESANARELLATLEAKVDSLRKEGARVEWALGQALNEIRSKDLWRAAGTKDEPFGSFADYVTSRFGFTRQTAENYINIATTFTQEDSAKLGPHALSLIAKVTNDGDRKKLLKETIDKGLTRSAITERIAKIREDNGEAPKSRGGYENKIRVHAWVEAGEVAAGEWRELRGNRTAVFELGGAKFELIDFGKKGGFKLRASAAKK